MDTGGTISPDILGTAEGIADPYPTMRALRGQSPVRYMRLPAGAVTGLKEPLYAWALLRHEDVLQAISDPTTFSSEAPRLIKAIPKLGLLHDDPPHHTHLRRLVSKAFSPQRIATLSDWIKRIAAELLDAAGRGPVELMSAYAVHLPVKVIAKMLGVPDAQYPAFRSCSEAIVSYTSVPAEERARKTKELVGYLDELIAQRRAQPQDDLISLLAMAEVEGEKLSDPEIRSFATLLLIAGNETTTNLIGNMMGILADRPELWHRARQDRSLVEQIIEETVRFETPVQRLSRVTLKPVRFRDFEIDEAQVVDVFFGAANRDPAVFDDPDTFRLARPRLREHLGFGYGTHFCLGAQLARLEGQVTLHACLDRFSTVSRGAEPAARQRVAQLSLGYKSLPLVLG
ncbi:MAG TPA: cytochrome P450 [Myxococcaceae bacterium]|nr:cytochrome P450 [Myxococcaceae bacterium]